LMERILARVREMSVDYEGRAISFTFSCGIADSTVCRQQECDLEKIIAEADTKLYRAKKAGRKRIYSSCRLNDPATTPEKELQTEIYFPLEG